MSSSTADVLKLGPVLDLFFSNISIFGWKVILLDKGIRYRHQLYLFKCI